MLAMWTRAFSAENKAQVIRTANGVLLFTNVLETAVMPVPAPAITLSADPIHALIETISDKHGVDPALVKAIVKTESNFDRWAVSAKGARGLMQLIPGTGARFGVRDFFDPRQNIEGGVRYMKFLLDKFKGNLDLSRAAYNAGENLVERLGRIPSIPETRNYVRKVRASYGVPAVKAAAPISAPVVAALNPVPAAPAVFRSVDERGVIHYSNVAPQT